MIPTVEQILALSAGLLGDPSQRKFTNAKLLPFFELAFEELTGEMARYHLPKQKRSVLYTLTASTTSLTPATASISNMGELVVLEERPSGSSNDYTIVAQVDKLPQEDAASDLRWFEWSNDQFNFVGATQNIQLRITYYDSGAAPTTGSVGIDGCKNYLAYRTAALAAIPSGNVELGVEYDRQARGPMRDGGGGFMHTLLQAMVVSMQKVKTQSPAYRKYPFSDFPA